MPLKLADFTAVLRRHIEDKALLEMMLQSQNIHPASLIVLHQIHSLYSEDSGNSANISRIAINLESIAADILSLSNSIRKLEQVRDSN